MNDWGTVAFIVVFALGLWVAITAPDAPGRIWGSTALWDVAGKVAILATIAGCVAAVVGVIVAIWAGLPQLRETRLELARIANQLTAAPNLVIGLPDKPDQADEGGLEWFHLEVANMASTEGIPLTAREAHVSVVVDDRTERHLMWSGGAFGLTVPVTDIRAGWPVRVPLAIRSRGGLGGEVLGTPIEADTCYLTDDEFCTQGRAGIILGEGLRRLDVTVQYGTEQVRVARARFELSVPGDEVSLMSISRVHAAEALWETPSRQCSNRASRQPSN